MKRLSVGVLPACLSVLLPAAGGAAGSRDEALAQSAAALLRARCWACHGEEARGGLDLRTRVTALRGGGKGAALAPGRPAESLMMRLIRGEVQPRMPQDGPLPDGEIRLLERWIAAGAPWPREKAGEPPAPGMAPARTRPHWSFVPPRRAQPPAVTIPGYERWVRGPVDRFILAGLARAGLTPSPEADRRTLLRRVTLDLTGLPPTPGELDAFLADRAPDAYERVVERLLASPRYGERWAQHWLDAVRYGETNGYELDAERPHAWRYRDYVVAALNEDRPYDRFLREQIAGDQLNPKDPGLLAATGFLRAGPLHVVSGNLDPKVLRQEWLTEAVTSVGAAVMGLTIGCARCHDHKYDPIPQADYYRLQAFFAATTDHDVPLATEEDRRRSAEALKAIGEKKAPILARIAAIEKPYRERLQAAKRARLDPAYVRVLATDPTHRTPEEKRLFAEAQVQLKVEWDELVAALSPEDRAKRAALRREMHAIDAGGPGPLPHAASVADTIRPIPPVHVLKLGDPASPAAEVAPGFLTALGASSPGPLPDGPRRVILAGWLTRPDHPLTARVIVNRLWHHHFGRGLVGSLNDFGLNGDRPTHPELLDWLATELVRQEWSLKAMHRLMVTSATYRQSSRNDARRASRDPENRLLWRANRRRLDAEAIRDSVLFVAGTLTEKLGGPPVKVPLEPEVYDTIFTEGEPDNLWPVTPDPREHTRRTLYLLRKRNVRLPLLVAFDAPDMMSPAGARGQSVHSLQSLALLNSPFTREQAERLAARVTADAPGVTERITRLYLLTLGRPPAAREAAASRVLPADAGEETSGWADLALAMLNRAEFIHVD